MIAIKCQRAQFIAIVLTGDRENRQGDLLKLLARWNHRVVVGVGDGMFQNALKIHGRISDERIERVERDVFLVSVEEFRAPEFLVGEKILLTGAATRKREPLHVVSFADVIERGIIKRRMRGRCRYDGGEVRRKFFRRRPLIEPGVRTAPHRDFPVAKRLLRQPLHDVVTIARLLRERFEFAGGIAATANIDKRKRVTVRREIGGACVITVRDVRREREDDRSL